jgi:predicted metal-dependent hydrolase
MALSTKASISLGADVCANAMHSCRPAFKGGEVRTFINSHYCNFVHKFKLGVLIALIYPRDPVQTWQACRFLLPNLPRETAVGGSDGFSHRVFQRRYTVDMRSFLQLTLDLFTDVVLPKKTEEKQPLAPIFIGLVAPESVANEVPSRPTEPIASVLRPSHFAHPRANREARLLTAAGKRADQSGGECIVAYEFRRAKRKTIGFIVGADGLVVSAPRWVPLHEVDKALQEKAVWIVKKLAEAQARQQKLANAQVEWKEGAMIPFLGEQVILVIDPRQASNASSGVAQLHTDASTLPGVPQLTLHLGLPHDASPERIRDSVQAWLMRQAKRIFEERLNHFAPQLGVRWTKLSLSNAESRWGSAGSNGAIRLNWRLVHFRQSVIDYVVVHELSHLRVMDHSPKFWSTVESIMPDYAQRKGMLKDEAIPRW